jgi:glycolate oxidase
MNSSTDQPEHEYPPISQAKLISALRGELPAHAIFSSNEDMRPFECDGLSAYTQMPFVVVLPETVEQVCAVMKLCHQLRVPVVARGAGTGLSGGALPHAEGVLLVLSKFNRILDIDPLAASARVEPGVRNLAISQAVAPHGLYYAPDPSSQIACSIGGNVAENAGGVHCLKYGLTVHNVLAIKLVTVSGELVEIGGRALDSAGYDLLALCIGSEGLLGIVVEVTVKLLPQPTVAKVALAAFDDVAKAAEVVGEIIAAGIIPAGLEMMDNPAIRAAEDYIGAGYPRDAAAILLCEVDGNDAETIAEIARVETLLRAAGATEVRIARDDAERLLFWAGRKSAFPAVGRLAPDYYCMDGTIPRRHLAEVLQRIGEFSKRYQLPVANVFHAGDGNLHPLILYDANDPDQLHRAEAFGGDILELCVAMGGTITGEHGVGIEKINQMCAQFGSEELKQFHALKTAFDPHRLLNPDKLIPILRRCNEFAQRHTHDE